MPLFNDFDWPESMYSHGDLPRTTPYIEIGNALQSLDIPDGPIFEYGPSTGVIRSALPADREFIVRNWPEVDCMRQDYPDYTFSAIMADYTLEHLAKPWLTAQYTYNMLMPGGVAIYTTHWMFPDHTGDQREDYCRYSPKGLECLFDMFDKTIVGCWGDAYIAGTFMIQNCYDKKDKLDKSCFPDYTVEELLAAKDRIYAVSTWVIGIK